MISCPLVVNKEEQRKVQQKQAKREISKAKRKSKRAPYFDTEAEEEQEVILNDEKESQKECECLSISTFLIL